MTSIINSKKNNIDEISPPSAISNTMKYILYFVLVIVIFTLSQIISINVNNKPLFDWWSQNGGNKYKKMINLFNVIAAYNSRYLYILSYLRTTPVASLTLQQGQFLMGELFPYQTWVNDKGEAFGVLTPRSICESIKPAPGMYDPIFDQWFYKNAIINGESQDYASNLIYNSSGKVEKDRNTGKYGVYPSNKDFQSWKGLISEWLGDKWEWTSRTDGSSTFQVPTPKPGNIDNLLGKWYENNTGRGDNFLARIGINPDSPLIIYFVNGTYSVNGMEVDAVAFENLLAPSGPGAGGWVGYMKGMGDDKSFDDYKKYIRTRVDSQPIPPKPPPCGAGERTKRGAISFFTSALPLIGFAVATGGWGGIAIGTAAVAGGGFSAYSSATSC